MEERYLTVTALTKYIKYKFDHDHNLEEVLLEGEVSNFKHNEKCDSVVVCAVRCDDEKITLICGEFFLEI